MDMHGNSTDDSVENDISFKLTINGQWSSMTWIDIGDIVRVIGTYSKLNDFHLILNNTVEMKLESQ